MDRAWVRVNRTEVYQCCLNAGMRVHPATTREQMVKYLTGEEEPPEEPHPIDSWRDGIMAFLLDYWKKVHIQLTCPAGSGDPKACFGCLDVQTIACILQSPNVEQLIESRRPGR